MKSRLAALLLGCATAAGAAPDWPGFRGPAMTGRATPNLPIYQLDQPVALELVWRRPIGTGYASMAVTEERVITSYSDGTEDWLAAFDPETGSERWRVSFGPTYPGHDGSFTGPIATPCIDRDLVFGLGPHGRLVAVRHAGGEVVWSHDLIRQGVPQPEYGFGTSPVVVAGTLVVLPGIEGTLSGFDPATGDRRWSAGGDPVTYQHGVPWRRGGAWQVLAAGKTLVFEVDPIDGRVRWQAEHGGGDAMGAYSLAPVVLSETQVFLKHQTHASLVWNLALGRPEIVWESRGLSKSYCVPVAHRGHLYGYRGMFLACVDASTGETRWETRSPGDGFLIAVDDRLAVLTKRGSVHLIEADPSAYREAAGLDVLSPPAWSLPVASGNRLYIRGMKDWARVDVVPRQAPSPQDAPIDDSVAGRLRAAARAGALDAFLATAPSFPWIEGDDTVHFLYQGPGEAVAVGGDMIGTRQMIPLKRFPGTDCFLYSMPFAADARACYAFSVDGRHVLDPRNDRQTSNAYYGAQMDIGDGRERTPFSWFSMPRWSRPTFLETAPAHTGQVHTVTFQSPSLEQSLPLHLYLPAGFEPQTTIGLVVVHGGDAARAHGDWVRALDVLVGRTVAPIAVLFLPEEPLALDMEDYARVVGEEILPWVLHSYPTIGDARMRAHVGAGSIGYAALYTAWRYPDLVKRAGAQSVYMLDKMERALGALLLEVDLREWTLYLDWGRYDLRNTVEAWDMGTTNREWFERIKATGATVHGGEAPDGAGWPSWRNRTDALLQALFPLPP